MKHDYTDLLRFAVQGVINYPKIKKVYDYEEFEYALITDKQNSAIINNFLKQAQAKYPKFILKKKLKELMEEEAKILPKEYVRRINLKASLERTSFYDLYKEEVDPSKIKSGDMAFISLIIMPSDYENKTYITIKSQILTILKPQAYQLFNIDAIVERQNEDYFNEIEKFKNKEQVSTQTVEAPDTAEWE